MTINECELDPLTAAAARSANGLDRVYILFYRGFLATAGCLYFIANETSTSTTAAIAAVLT